MGHVDAGKSTIGGHLLFLTGMVDKRTMEKYEKDAKEANRETWYLSWALDTNPEERSKGKTVEVGRAGFETETKRYTILDAPGHKSFVPNMIGGAAQADVGVLVISARKGEFEAGFDRQGQTREHALLAKTAGVRRMVVVINKMDDPTVKWEVDRYQEIVDKLKPYLKSCGYNPKTDLDWIPISGYTGANLVERAGSAVCSWYDGPSLVELLDTMTKLSRNNNLPLRLPVMEKYKDMGTIVAGKLEAGSLRVGQKCMMMPNSVVVEVQSLAIDEEDVKNANSGDNVRLRLRGIDDEDVSVGFVLCGPKLQVKVCQEFEAQVAILEHKSIICAGYKAVMHIHTLVEEIILSQLLHMVDKKTGKKTKKPPQFVKTGNVMICRIQTEGPICLETYQEFAQLGHCSPFVPQCETAQLCEFLVRFQTVGTMGPRLLNFSTP
eukprot:Lithocolla_globosa_v1_NODE_2868_length_1841_cov_741.629899.p1 type:complete len:436 gc:universal NODE_2868_length_1841_cov_741.629899:526-1833(+)